MPILAFVFVTSALVLTTPISRYIAFNVRPSPIQDANGTKYKTSPHTQFSIGNTITSSSSTSSRQSSTAPHNGCINYNPSKRTITVSCSSARLTDIDNKLHDASILARQSPTGVWFLNANLVIAKGATFHIDSTDTKWLKIGSKVTRVYGSAKMAPAYVIDVHGSLKIDSVKITSWDPTTNNYAITNGSREAVPPGTKGATPNGYIIHYGAPRGFIKIEHDATGTTDITNSEIAYLGYESGSTSDIGSGGLNYYGANGSVIRGNNIHDLYFGFYSSGVGHMIIENNQVYHNANYGLDPHTGTHDMIIQHNIVHDNGAQGIICSLNCYNVLIENNQIYNNGGSGIMLSRNMSNSIVRNNIIYNEVNGILVSQSHYNKIYNNTISDSQYGIDVVFGSSGNTFYSNVIKNSSHGIDSRSNFK